MAERTNIEWCDSTLNLWWGCTKVSQGCKFCYAEHLSDQRYGKGCWGPTGTRQEVKTWRSTLNKISRRAEAEGRRLRVFCSSMCDVFEGPETCGGVDSDNFQLVHKLRVQLFAEIVRRPELDFLVLTKRPSIARAILGYPQFWLEVNTCLWENLHCVLPGEFGDYTRGRKILQNLWIGTSVEDQATADERVPQLLMIPAKTRFLSCEPLLGAVTLTKYLGYNEFYESGECGGDFATGSVDESFGDRRTRTRLESGGASREPLESVSEDCSDRENQGGASSAIWLPSSALDGSGQESSCASSSPGLEALPRTDPRWWGDQSPQRIQGRQSTREPAIDDAIRESETCAHDEAERAGWRTQPVCEAVGQGCRDNSPSLCSPGPTGDSSGTRAGVRRNPQNDIQDCERRTTEPPRRSDCRLHGQESLGERIHGTRQSRAISLVIVGGESGPNARPMHPDWARSLRDQCQESCVPFFFKQWGEWLPWSHFNAAEIPDDCESSRHLAACLDGDGGWRQGYMSWEDDADGKEILGRVGKKRAGSLLDGEEWKQFPEGWAR